MIPGDRLTGRDRPHRSSATPLRRSVKHSGFWKTYDTHVKPELFTAVSKGSFLRHGTSRIEVFSPGFAVHGRAREASLQVSTVSRPSAECLLAGACCEGPRWKSLITRCRPGQRRRSQPSTGTDSW